MNAKLARQVEEMKKQTIGVEVEMNSIARDKAARVAAKFFGTGRHEYTARRNGYETYSAWDAQGREWKFQKDVSIAGPDSEKCELVTPILTYGDIETLQELIRQLRHAGAKSDAGRGCGVHIHIGAKGHTPQSLRNLANIMAGHESLIADALNLDRWRMNRYCRTVDPRFLEEVNRKKPATMAALADIWYTSHGANYPGTCSKGGIGMKETDNIARISVCPRCGQTYHGRPAVSRADGKTPLCPDCGTREALESIGVDGKEQEQILAAIHRCYGRG